MNRLRYRRPFIVSAAVLSAASFTACSDSSIERVLANDTGGYTFDDFAGRTFPIYFARGEEGENLDDRAETDAGIGEVKIISETELEATIPGLGTFLFTCGAGLCTADDVDGEGGIIQVELEDFGPIGFAYSGIPGFLPDEQPFFGLFGFETPVDQRPAATASYNDEGFGVLFIEITGSDNATIDRLSCLGCVALEADFAAGTIDGVVFDGAGEDAVGGTLSATNTLDGEITSTGFTGTITADIDYTPDGGDPLGLTNELSNQEVIGRFFGSEGEIAGVAYDADILINGGETSFEGSMAGASLGADTSLE